MNEEKTRPENRAENKKADSPAEWEPGDVILDTYEVTEVLGEGGQGKVYKVHHRNWNADLAVKCALPEIAATEKGRENFTREAETWTNLGLHPNIVYCYYVRTIGKVPRVFSEYIDGGSLADSIEGGSLYEGGKGNALMRILDIAIQSAWDVTTGQCLRVFNCRKWTSTVCISQDSKYILSGSGENMIRLWEVKTGTCLRTFKGHTKRVNSVCMSPDGRVLSGSEDKTLRLWDIKTGECLRTFEGHTQWVMSVCISPDGKFALSGSRDNTLRLWDIETGKCLRIFEGHTSWIKSVCMSKDGSYAISGDSDNTLRLWDIKTGICMRTFEGNSPVCISSDGRYVISGAEASSHVLRLWDIATGKCLYTLKGHTNIVWSVCMSADGKYAVSGGNDNTVILWNIDTVADNVAPIMLSEMQDAGRIISEQLDSNDKIIQAREKSIAGDFAGKYRVMLELLQNKPSISDDLMNEWAGLYIKLPKKRLINEWVRQTFTDNPNASYYCMSTCMSANGRYALSGGLYDPPRLWDVSTGRCLYRFNGHTDWITSVCLSADGRYGLSASWDKTLRLWDLSSGECIRILGKRFGHAESICMSPDGRYALAGGYRSLTLWDLKTGERLYTLKGNSGYINSICISADGQYALAGGYKRLQLWHLPSGRRIRTFKGHTDSIMSVCMSVDGRQAVSSSKDGTIRLWDIATGNCLNTMKGHDNAVLSVCMIANGNYLLSSGNGHCDPWEVDKLWQVYRFFIRRYRIQGDEKKTLKLWDLVSGECIHTFEGYASSEFSVCISADGRYILSGNYDGTLRLWELYWEQEPKEAADWNDGAKPYLLNFLILHTPYAGKRLTPTGSPSWAEKDFQVLLYDLGCAGFGWLRLEGVRAKLNELAAGMKDGNYTGKTKRFFGLFK